MWILHLLPDSLILFFTYAMIFVGLAGLIVGFFLNKLAVKIVSFLIFCCGIYWYGGYSTEMAWRERVAEMEEKVRQAEKKSEAANAEIEQRVVEKTKLVRDKGRKQIEYIYRLVEGKTVEVVKDMSEQDKQIFMAKQKELQDALKNCPVPRIIVEEHNKAAEPK